MSANANMDMTLGAFVEIYFRDKAGELKERSVKNKKYMIKAHILPYFENKPMNSIKRYWMKLDSFGVAVKSFPRAKCMSRTFLP